MRFRQAALALALFAAGAQAEIQPEALNQVVTLPSDYPPHWIFAHDAAFFHMTNGRYVLLDPTAETGPAQYLGMVDAGLIAAFAQSPSRGEFYVAETYYSRGTRGERLDVVTIYDVATLAPKGEVALPKEQVRMVAMPEKYGATIVADKFLVVSNMSPATGVSIVDLDTREVVESTLLPGCILNFPTGERGFTGICVDGSLKTFALDAQGKISKTTPTDAFFNPQTDPFFEKPAIVDGKGYFIAFDGRVQEVDLSGEAAVLGEAWHLLDDEAKGKKYRPGGWQLHGTDDSGLLYILMHENGGEGTHKNGGNELWVYDLQKRERVAQMALKNHGISVTVTHGDAPYVVITTADLQLDVYHNREFVRRLEPFGQETPFVVHANAF
ncbi:MAG: amine dehydrogenase large subunit [Cardiobacteriaceae bacterium]|nr:amine dehydrogenase large subunit [Cardiobacteriaceae bacterium]